MKNYVAFNPARLVAAVGVLIQAAVTLVALLQSWLPELILAIDGITTAFMAVISTLFVEAKTTNTAALNELAAAVDNQPPAE